MEERIITREVKLSTMNQEWEDLREYSVSLNTLKTPQGKSRIFVDVQGVDDECDGQIGVPVEDVPLLVQALKEFC